MAFIAGTQSDDIFIPTVNDYTYLGGAGNDTYVITKAVTPGAVVVIADTEGSNKIQLTNGLTVVSSQFAADAVEMTLSNGARVQLLHAASFGFDIGANATSGDTALYPNQSYAQFANAFGITSVPTGSGIASGTPYYIVANYTGYVAPSVALTNATPGTEGGTASFSLALSNRLYGQNYSVDLALTGSGGAVAGVDFDSTLTLDAASAAAGIQLVNGTLLIPTSSAVTNVTLSSSVMSDAVSPETGEGMTFTMSAPSNGAYISFSKPSTTVAIQDVPALTYTLSPIAPSILEGKALTFTVTASAPVAVDTKVTFTVQAPDAQGPNAGSRLTNAADFAVDTLTPSTLTIPPGKNSVSFTATALDDFLTELPEDYKLIAAINGVTTLATPVTVLDQLATSNSNLSTTAEVGGFPGFVLGAAGDAAPGNSTMKVDLAGLSAATDTTPAALQTAWP